MVVHHLVVTLVFLWEEMSSSPTPPSYPKTSVDTPMLKIYDFWNLPLGKFSLKLLKQVSFGWCVQPPHAGWTLVPWFQKSHSETFLFLRALPKCCFSQNSVPEYAESRHWLFGQLLSMQCPRIMVRWGWECSMLNSRCCILPNMDNSTGRPMSPFSYQSNENNNSVWNITLWWKEKICGLYFSWYAMPPGW